MKKLFRETLEKHSSNGVQRREMVRRSMTLTLAVYKWNMGWGEMSLGWAGWGAERDHGL